MNTIEIRRSVREFLDKPIQRSFVENIIKAGTMAPSARNQQAWEFILVDDKELLEALSLGGSPLYRTGSVAVILCYREELLKTPNMVSQDMGACMENMLLEATNLGIGSCWIGTYPHEDRMNHLRDVLQIPAYLTPFSGLVLGYPKDPNAFHSVERKAVIHYNKYHA